MDHRRLQLRCLAAATWILVPVAVTGGCGKSSTELSPAKVPPAEVVVASFNFPESELLAQIYGQALLARGVPVRMEMDLGTREMVLPAFQTGMIDLVPDYVGSALQAINPGVSVDMADTSAVTTGLAEALLAWHGEVLSPSQAEDENGLVVTRHTAARYGLRSISDLVPYATRLTFSAPPECPTRPYCLVGIQSVYGLHFASLLPLATEEERITALNQGVADVALVFTTSPSLTDPDLVLLEDDKHLQPADHVAPIVSDRVVALYGVRLTEALDIVSARLTSRELTFLNWRVSVEGRSPAEEAHGWLVRQGLTPRR
jgi:osmoprotectant transport system substrate-binding protein